MSLCTVVLFTLAACGGDQATNSTRSGGLNASSAQSFALSSTGNNGGGSSSKNDGGGDSGSPIVLASNGNAVAAGGVEKAFHPLAKSFALPSDELAAVMHAYPSRHEAVADGLPLSYDWGQYSRLRAGNNPPQGMHAMTGWGHVFWIGGAHSWGHSVEIRNTQTLMCTGTSRRWARVQQGTIDGAAFRADFQNDENVPASMVGAGADTARVSFPGGRAFHYWPKHGRAELDGQPICGVIVKFQARAVASNGVELPAGTPPAMLIGAGADYWTTTTASWADHTTNPGLAIGQLRALTPEWRWYGLNTAAQADIDNLQAYGFIDR
ncbi:MAG: hypothetical protein LH480_12495 [Rubrivivax sp.]|nr:hypothetical protein [Rubrivivax sp.]